jgi:hypothetical protein
MSKCSGNLRTICGLAAAAAIIVACPARAEDAICNRTTFYNLDLSENPVGALGHVTSAANRVHFVKGSSSQLGCPSRAPVCAKPDYLVPGDRVIISARRDVFICATYTDAKGEDRSGWLPADAVADDKAGPVALADWLGHWHHSNDAHDGYAYEEGDITVKAGKAGALEIEGAASNWFKGKARREFAAAIKGDVTPPAGDRLSSTINDCKVWMQRLGPWLIVSDDHLCPGDGPDGSNATFRRVYTRRP